MEDGLDDFWDDLLEFIEERRVVPIVGPEVLLADGAGGREPFHAVLAGRLAEKLRVRLPDGADRTLDQVARAFLAQGGRREEIYPRLRSVARETHFEVPPALLALASIEAFDLFISLTFDSLLVEALDQVRFGGEARTQHLAFCPNRVEDLPAERAQLDRPVVYSIFGRLSAAPEYVVTHEDLLEFSTQLQSEVRRPHLLFDELRSSHLLVIGSALPDWLQRFFLRITKNRQLSQQRSELEIVVGREARRDDALVAFFANYSYGTRLFDIDPEGFVLELARRWSTSGRRAAPKAADPAPGAAMVQAEAGVPMAPGSVFLSYSRDDLASVLALREALVRAGVDAWLDKDRLEAGDQYDQKIRRYIKTCAAFIPVISRNTERRVEGYFRREWKLAVERGLGIADDAAFILPVVIDDTPEYCSSVPESFLAAQWTRTPEGRPPADFPARVAKIVADYRRRRGAPE